VIGPRYLVWQYCKKLLINTEETGGDRVYFVGTGESDTKIARVRVGLQAGDVV